MLPPPPITGAPASIAAFIGRARRGPLHRPVAVASFAEFTRNFGVIDRRWPMAQAVRDFFAHGGTRARIVRRTRDHLRAIDALPAAFNLLCLIPDRIDGDLPPSVWQAALRACVDRGALLIVDPPAPRDLGFFEPAQTQNAAAYVPRPEGRLASGMVAGIIARTAVWKAPAGIEAVIDAKVPPLSDDGIEALTAAGINPLRELPDGRSVIWGARTLSPDVRYVALRRTLLYIEQSIRNGLAWTAFERNDEPLWARVRLSVENFLTTLWRDGAFAARRAEDAFFVRCDASTMTQDDIDSGRLNVEIGIAPLRPAEFVVVRIGTFARRPDP